MKKITLIICLAIATTNIYAENVKGVLKRATVYFSGAELTHTVNVSLRQGENSLTIEGLTPNIDVNSLKIYYRLSDRKEIVGLYQETQRFYR